MVQFTEKKKKKSIFPPLSTTLDTNHWEKFESFASPFLIT